MFSYPCTINWIGVTFIYHSKLEYKRCQIYECTTFYLQNERIFPNQQVQKFVQRHILAQQCYLWSCWKLCSSFNWNPSYLRNIQRSVRLLLRKRFHCQILSKLRNAIQSKGWKVQIALQVTNDRNWFQVQVLLMDHLNYPFASTYSRLALFLKLDGYQPH